MSVSHSQSVRLIAALAVIFLFGLNPSNLAWTQAPQKDSHSNSPDAVARGKYLVEGVAMCTQCHTPRTSAGVLDSTRWLQGAPLWLNPAKPVADWPLNAPRIAGLVPGSNDDMVKLLTTGIWRNGQPPRPPMPQFRMSQQDAEAVATYLRSLHSPPEQ